MGRMENQGCQPAWSPRLPRVCQPQKSLLPHVPREDHPTCSLPHGHASMISPQRNCSAPRM